MKDKLRTKTWIINSANVKLLDLTDEKVLREKLICEQHFDRKEFRDPSVSPKFLNFNAVPMKYISNLTSGKHSLSNINHRSVNA